MENSRQKFSPKKNSLQNLTYFQNVISNPVTIKKCPYSELPLYYILLKYCRNAIYFMIIKINRMGTAWLKEEGGLFIFDFCIQMRGGGAYLFLYPNEDGGLFIFYFCIQMRGRGYWRGV